LNNWSRSITAWNLVLDQNGKPNIGPFPCGGTVTLDTRSNDVVHSGQYWALAHLSRHIRCGARVIATNSMEPVPAGGSLLGDNRSTSLTHSAFRNPDGTMVAVLANRGDRRQVQLVLGRESLDIAVPADSLLTLQWS
jgi:glucosylceramidase